MGNQFKAIKTSAFIKLTILIMFLSILLSCSIDKNKTMNDAGNNTAVGYDSIKANKYGADKYGMKKYVLAFLKRGAYKEKDSVKAAELQAAHLRNINQMVEEGKLVLAGPFLDGGELRGIYIFNVQSIEEAETLTNTDPAIKAGSLVMELKPWYGSAALLEITDIHKIIAEQNP